MAEDSGLLNEIDEALRADRLQQFWASHSGIIIACCVLAVLSASASALWKSHMHGVHARQTGNLVQAALQAENNDAKGAIETLKKVQADGGQLAALAGLKEAQISLDMNQPKEALTAYNDLAVAKYGKAQILFHDYAALQADVLAYNQGPMKDISSAAADVGKKARSDGRVFADAFAELDAIRAKDGKTTAPLLEGIINNPEAPFSQRARAMELLDFLKESQP